jgi:hypothetical protein
MIDSIPGADQVGAERCCVPVSAIVIRTVPKTDALEAMLKSDTQERRGSVPEDRMCRYVIVQMGFARREDHSMAAEVLVRLPIVTERFERCTRLC